MTFVT